MRMGRNFRPVVEGMESRELLSAITVMLAKRQLTAQATNSGSGNTATSSTAPLSPHEQSRIAFAASFTGPYSVAAGRNADQARQIYMKVNGTSTPMARAFAQVGIFTPADPT